MLESHTGHSGTADNVIHESSIGGLLIKWGKLSEAEVQRILIRQRAKHSFFGEIAKGIGLITDSDLQAVLAHQRGAGRLGDGTGNWPDELITAGPSASPAAEVYRELRLQLMQRWFSLGHKTLAFLSVDEQIGTSFFIANLALTFAQSGQPTLLIDANLRRPRQGKIFHVPTGTGLVELLSKPDHADFIPQATPFRHLSVLSAGSTTPASFELLASSGFPIIAKRLASMYGITLVDLPSLRLGPDALAVAGELGGGVLVARKDRTRVTEISAVERKLRNLGVQVVGSVLIDFQEKKSTAG